MKKILVFCFVPMGLIAALNAAVPDLTSKLELVGNPTLEKWKMPNLASSVMDLQTYKGKVYVGTGNYAANSGASPIWAYDPKSKKFVNEFTAGTEAIEIMRVLSDGHLYIPATDPAGGPNNGSLFRKEDDGSWTVIPENRICRTHMYDVELCKGVLYVCGYDTMKSADYGKTWTKGHDQTWLFSADRLYALVRCGDELFCKNFGNIKLDAEGNSVPGSEKGGFRMWALRLNGDTLTAYNSDGWEDVAPGFTRKDLALAMGPDTHADRCIVRLWHPTPFGDRNLYVVGDDYVLRDYKTPVAAKKNLCAGTRPMMAVSGYAADDGNGGRKLKGDRIQLPEGYWPIDFCVCDNAAYMLAFAYNAKDQNVRHGVWKTTDGKTFTQILAFDYQQVMMSLEYLDGYFYFGVTHKTSLIAIGALKTDTPESAGSIYRIRCPQKPVVSKKSAATKKSSLSKKKSTAK